MQIDVKRTGDYATTRFLRRAQAAQHVQTTYGFPCSRQWLAKLAVTGGGPIYRKAGRTPIYAPADFHAWAMERIGAPHEFTSRIDAVRALPPALANDGGRT